MTGFGHNNFIRMFNRLLRNQSLIGQKVAKTAVLLKKLEARTIDKRPSTFLILVGQQDIGIGYCIENSETMAG